MSIKIMQLVWTTKLPAPKKLVLLALADNANDEGDCYPSITTLTRKCSLSDRAVQYAISQLVEEGHVSREIRAGRSTLYKVHPRPEVSESHYVYRIEDVDSGEFYIGVRTCPGDPATDAYFGSGAWVARAQASGKALRKTVVATFATRDAAAAAEAEIIRKAKEDSRCMNERTPAPDAPRTTCTTHPVHPTPAPRAPHPRTTCTHNHQGTVKEPSRRAASGGPKTSSARDPAGEKAPDESTLDKALFAEARKIFGQSIGGQINTAIRLKGKAWVVGIIEACRKMDEQQARAYLAAAMKGVSKPNEAQQRKVIP